MAVKDAVSLGGKESIHGDDDFFIVVFDPLQVAKLPLDDGFTAQTVTYLDVFLFVLPLGDEVDLGLIDDTNGYFVPPYLQFLENDVLQKPAYVSFSITDQAVTKPDVVEEDFVGKLQEPLPFDVIPRRFVDQQALFNVVDVVQDGVHGGSDSLRFEETFAQLSPFSQRLPEYFPELIGPK